VGRPSKGSSCGTASHNHATTGEKEVVGLVALAMPISETGPFRGYVEKLIVVHEHRRKGIAKALMLKMEEAALKEGRTLLVCD
jgi:GNAT superfamily N-acetyltransferase